MKFHERLAVLEFSPVATWVFDTDFFRQRWANKAALELWRAKTPEELYARDYSDMSASTRSRMQGYIAQFRAGHSAEEEWTLYPKGEPVTMKLFLSGVPFDDDRTGVLIQAFEKAQAPAPDLVRSVEALRHTSLMVTLTDIDGTILLQNPAAIRAFGSTHPLADRFVDEVVSEAILAAARAGEVFLLETQVKTEEGAKWHAIEARTLRDPATGAIVVLIQHTDETLRRQAEQRAVIEGQLAEELRGTLAVVEQQKAEIIALSAPILEVSAGTIAVPIIGTLDSERAQALEQSILAMVSNRGAMSVILDLTGTNALSTAQTVEQVVRLGRAIRLLGAQTIVTGIMSTLARTLVTADVDMGGVLLLRSLRDGIAAAGKRHGR
jgi:anti-anti-sigma regulatory factor/PAS domain-containing protein